jgi:hypothetical protein
MRQLQIPPLLSAATAKQLGHGDMAVFDHKIQRGTAVAVGKRRVGTIIE